MVESSKHSNTDLVFEFLHCRPVVLADALLMVAQDSNHAICLVVRCEFFQKRAILRCTFVKLLLESDGSVVGTEDFSSKTLHGRREMLVDEGGLEAHVNIIVYSRANSKRGILRYTHGDSIEDSIPFRLWLALEDPDVLVDLWVDIDSITVPNGILAQEIKYKRVWRFQSDVLVAEGAAADSIGFVFALFVSSTKR